MTIPEIIDQIIYARKKKEAMDLIYSAEVSVMASGMSIIEVLKNVRAELKSNVFIDRAVVLLEKGKPRSVAYKGVLSSDILNILKSAESKQITAGDIFSEYIELKHIIENAQGRMSSALMEPTLIYLMVGGISYFAINTFYNGFRGIPNLDMSTIAFLRNWYFFIMLAPIFAVHTLIIKLPDRMPIWNRVYRYVKSAGYLLVIKTLYDLGLSSADAIQFFKKLNDKRLNKRINMLKTHEKSIEGLAKVLQYYLSPVEMALIKTSVKFAEEKRVLDGIVERRMMDVEKTVSGVTAVFNKMLTALAILPVGMVVYVLLTIITAMARGA